MNIKNMKNAIDLIELNSTELTEIEGGGFFEQAGYWAGRIAGAFTRAQEREMDGGIGGPTAAHG